ncbi:MAG: FAD-dependent oxidoreductase, partial [Bdellovibrionia bacterium]
PSKGVHVILEKKRLPVEDAVVMSTRTDKRIVFVIPRHEMVILGTTDTDFSGDPADVHTDAGDVDYIVEVAKRYFPGAKLTRDDFISSYAGVRPLVADDASTESGTSREHLIIADPRNVTFVAGGKYTTYRHMGEQTINTALKNFSLEERVRFGRNDTKTPLNPAASPSNLERARRMTQCWSDETPFFSEKDVAFLVGRHGMEAEKLLEFATKNKIENIWELEASFAINQTMCLALDDFYLRRVPLFLTRRDHGLSEAPRIARYFANAFSWTDNELAENLKKIQNHIRHELSWQSTS